MHRLVCLVALAACGSNRGPRAAPPQPQPTPEQPPIASQPPPVQPAPTPTPAPVPPPPPPEHPLARAGKIFAIDADVQPVVCREWAVSSSSLTRPGLEISFQLDANRIEITNATATEGEDLSLDGTCEIGLALREEADAFDLGGAKWFKTKAACDKAVAAKAKVALDLQGCAIRPFAPVAERTSARDKLEAVVGKGGRLFELTAKNVCAPIAFTPSRARYDDYMEGAVAAPPLKFTYLMRKGGMMFTLIGPKAKPHRDLECSRGFDITGDKDTVFIGRTVFLTEAGCKARIAANAERAKWVVALPPPPPPDPDADVNVESWLELSKDTCGDGDE